MVETLWRGANTTGMWNPTRYFRSSGIITKLADGGDPAYLTRVGMLAAISAHVAPKTSMEREFMARSAFASFSASRERAMHYARGRTGRQVVESGRLDHEVVLFKMDVSRRNPERAPGTYLLKYDCDDSIREPDFQEDMDLVQNGWGLAGGCEFCKDGRRPHTLFLIDVAEYIRAQPLHSRDEDALGNATTDEEWLVLPIDHIERLRGDAAHIPRSSIWTYETFKFAS